MGLYGVFGIFVYVYSMRQTQAINFVAIFVYWIFCVINYIAFPALNEYFSSTSFLLSTLYFFPIGALIIYRIDNWENFFKIYTPFALISALLGIFIVFFSNSVQSGNGEFFSYMEFSYNMLPACMALYCVWRKSKNLIVLGGFLISLVSIISFGARAAVLYGIIFVLCYEIFNSKIKAYKLVLLTAVIVIIGAYLDDIVGYLLQLDIFSDSRLLNHIVGDNLFESRGRDFISESCLRRIDIVGFEYSGMFGDRPFLNGAIYPHNIFYEIIMQYGWFFGCLIFAYLLYLIGYDFFIKKHKIIILFAALSLFGRYIISGSYLIEGKFWIFIFIMLSIRRFCKPLNSKF
jgi:hypothetical protein